MQPHKMLPILVLLLSSAFIAEGNDCGAAGGICQDDNQQCLGSYLTGKCPGARNIRCCLKKNIVIPTTSCTNVPVLSRDSWGARRPTARDNIPSAVRLFFIHHTDTPSCSNLENCSRRLRSIQMYHMKERNFSDIGYSFLVGEDGRVYEGRGWGIVGAHTLHYNSISYAASFIGNYTSHLPPKQSMDAAKRLIQCGVNIGFLRKDYGILGHRDVSDTECPGEALYREIRTWPHYNYTKVHV